MHNTFRGARMIAAVLTTAALGSCGGGDSKNATSGVLAQSCSPNNPYRADATSAITSGNIGIEKTWLRDYIDRNYLWYDKVPAVNPADALYSNDTPSGFYDSIDTYFLDLTRPITNPPGKPVDKFSFTYPTAAWDQLINSGSTVGYGIEWHFASSTPPRNIRVSYVHPGSQADIAQVKRGDTLVLADNVAADDNTPTGVAMLNAALFPALNSQHSFRFSRSGVPAADYTFVAGNVALKPVQSQVLNVNGARVGYLLFNDHVLPAEVDLISAFASFSAAPGISDLVLDLRYNGGGYLYIASEVAYMIAGAARTNSQVFEATVFSSKRSGENSSGGFSDLACVPNPGTFQCTRSDQLPALNLSRVYVLVSGSTCSASEAIINSLRGVDVEVHLIGGTTCGKPYGFFSQDNCGITYFPIEFQGVNAKGFGSYANGFVPGGTGTTADNLPGCAANDDFNHQLGDPAEGQLAAALSYRNSANTACLPLAVANRATPLAAGQSTAVAQGHVIKPAVLTNRNGRMPSR
jgi:carboxyl-terminal processing protease